MARSKLQAEWAHAIQSPSVRRALGLGGLLAVWMMAVLLRLYDLQVIQYVQLLGRAERQQQRIVEVAPHRGIIYDRQMNPLAMSLPADSIYAVPTQIADPNMVAGLLAPILGLNSQELAGRIEASRSFCWIKRKVSSEESARVHALDLSGVYFQKEMKRFYPKGELAAQVLGYVGVDDKGLAGLEYGLNDQIRGRPGRLLVETDARHQSFRSRAWSGRPGDNVVLTLDQAIQYIAEKELAKAVEKYHAKGGAAIVQNPSTGEILAMASQPIFDPNHFEQASPGATENRGVAWIYEPGSTFKLVTVSAALEEGLARPDEVIDCQEGSIVLANHVIHDHERFGNLRVAEILMYSSDVGAIKLGLRLGEERLYDYIRRFGFDAKTEAGFPSEERGLLEPPSRWSGISIGEISIGQEIGVTPLQMVSAYSAIANGGVMVQPRIVHDIYRGNDHEPLPAPKARRVVSERTAELMKQMLEGVVQHGTGTSAQLDGYTAAGKTGTAQKVNAEGRYSHRQYVASFIGFAPAQHPAITILVAIDSPVGAIYGAEVAAPAFKAIAEQTLRYLSVPQDNPSRWLQLASRTHAAPFRQQRKGAAGNLPISLGAAGAATRPVFPVAFSKAGPTPSSGTVLMQDGRRVMVPDFYGMDARRVAAECQKLGLGAQLTGMGLAAAQMPSAGARVAAGTQVWVRLAR